MAALLHFQPYSYGQPFLLQTDHASFAWLLNFRESEGQLAWWLEQLQDYQFTVLGGYINTVDIGSRQRRGSEGNHMVYYHIALGAHAYVRCCTSLRHATYFPTCAATGQGTAPSTTGEQSSSVLGHGVDSVFLAAGLCHNLTPQL